MRRQILLITAVLVGALVALVVVGSRVLDRDREELYERYARERLHVLEEAGRVLERDVEEAIRDLELAATLLDGVESDLVAERQLQAIATIKREYLLIETQRADGRRLRVIADDAPPGIAERVGATVTAVLASAAQGPDRLEVSGALGEGDDPAAWYRVLARSSSAHRDAIAVVIDARVLLSHLDVLRDRASNLFIVGGDRRTTLRASALPPPLRPLIDVARTQGTAVAVFEPGALAGYSQPEVPVAVAATVRIGETAEPWTLVRVSSAAPLRAQERTLVRRLVLGGALALGLLIASAAYVLYNTRRAAVLRERLRHADRLASLTERVLHSEKLATAGQLAAGIAHEIGTPLNVVRGRAELALGKLGADHPQAPAQRVIIDEVDRVTRLIGQLLGYVRSGAAEPRAVDAAAALSHVAVLLGPQAGERGVALEVDAAPDLRALRADPDQLQQTLVNLVKNALDASPRGGRVVLRARPAPGAVVLEVADDGPGIPPELRAQVLDPFFTTKKRGQGTGLGLWIVAQLVRAHGGALVIDANAAGAGSGAGTGTIVRVTWPAEPGGAA